ncbi:MAG: sodium:solute symporter [Saprospiraceae bacterium]|nr:sodium:solute symporter [Saprospiraceae bacterium]
MHWIDWTVMLLTLVTIVVYGVYRTRDVSDVKTYLMGHKDLPWWTIGLSIMATQASAITFLSTPGQAFDDGMRFAQFYFGLPIAMVFLSIFVLPIFYRLNIYTAYEYLEQRFDLKTRTLTASLFLLSRGLAAGITIYAPSIILSSLMGWNLTLTNLLMGVLVIVYTVVGGTKAVSVTQKQQMIIILGGMAITALILLYKLPAHVGFTEAVQVAGKMGKLNIVDFSFDLSNRYTFWSGILGGTFLFLSYFGTDQSQVQRYLSGRSLRESRLGLLFNGIIKVPMQFLILFVGILVYVFYLYTPSPVHFNRANVLKVEKSESYDDYKVLEAANGIIQADRRKAADQLILALDSGDEVSIAQTQSAMKALQTAERANREEVRTLIKEVSPLMDTNDLDYVFVSFVTDFLPIGLVGLLLAVIFSAAMSSISSELNALATTTVVDVYRRSLVTKKSDSHYLSASRWFTVGWGMVALIFAETASLFDNLIQAVNIIGSLFYGTLLGIFLTAFFLKRVKGHAVFLAALIGEASVLITFWLSQNGYLSIAYLWLNLIGCVIVMVAATLLSYLNLNRSR